MLFRSLFFFLFVGFWVFPVLSQSKLYDLPEEIFWTDDPYENLNEVNEKYSNEPAVILAKEEDYFFYDFTSTVRLRLGVRQRIKVLDQLGVDKYSSFSILGLLNDSQWNFLNQYSFENMSYRCRQIKLSGDIIDLTDQIIKTDNEIKLAVPNLEKGDILDVILIASSTFSGYSWIYFQPVLSIIGDEHSVENYNLNIDLEKDFYVLFDTYNTDSKLIEVENEKRNRKTYQLNLKNIDNFISDEIFYNPLTTLPYYKFQTIFAKNRQVASTARYNQLYSDNIGTVTKNIPLGLVSEMARKYTSRDPSLLNYYKKWKKSPHPKTLEENFYHERYNALIRDEEVKYAINGYTFQNHFFWKNPQFHMINILYTNAVNGGLKPRLYVCKPQPEDDLSQITIPENLYFIMEIDDDEPVVVSRITTNAWYGYLPSFLEGAKKVLIARDDTFSENPSIENAEIIPVSLAEDNVFAIEGNVIFKDDLQNVAVEVDEWFTGHAKYSQLNERVPWQDIADEEYKRFGDDVPPFYKQSDRKKYYEVFLSRRQKEQKQYEDYNKELVASHGFDKEKLIDFSYDIVSLGRYEKDEKLQIKSRFSSPSEFVKKAGKNSLFEIGKLISSQIEITKEREKRENDIFIDFARTYIYNYTIVLPKNVSVSGLDELNTFVENSCGLFKSTCSLVEGNTLKIEVKKVYKKNFYKADEWHNLVDFMRLADDFMDAKILLKKQ